MAAAVREKIDTNPEIWGAKQVADYLKLSVKHVYIMARRGDIPCTIIGDKTFRFSRAKIVNLV